jgi:dihydroorotate dehydrogenase electron transfer subunit
MEVIAFAGAQSLDRLPFEKPFGDFNCEATLCLNEFSRSAAKSIVATDDGSAGVKGFVTTAMESWLDKCKVEMKDIIIYCCGPEVMLAAMAKIAQKRGIDCQVSMERRMACGIGLCQSCAVECRKEGTDETFYKMCCKDGPVFDSREVVFTL